MKQQRQKIYERFRLDPKHKDAFNRLMDKYELVERNHCIACTEFLNPETIAALMPVITSLRDVGYQLTGGYIRAEYQIVILYPDYFYLEPDDIPLKVIRIIPRDKDGSISHRDILGSVLGIGIKREKTGDILIHDDFFQIIVMEGMEKIIPSQLDRIRKTPVDVRVETLDDLEPVEEHFEVLETVVASERLDAILASVWHVSRGKASDLIRAEKVKVNYQITKSSGASLKTGDLISCRGKGRFYYDGILKTTRKDRIRIQIRKVL